MSKFKVGDELYYLDETNGRENYKCIVINIDQFGKTLVRFSAKKDWDGYKTGDRFGNYIFPDSAYELAGPPLTKEQKIENKCKKLWNNSNYIKHNPHLAY